MAETGYILHDHDMDLLSNPYEQMLTLNFLVCEESIRLHNYFVMALSLL